MKKHLAKRNLFPRGRSTGKVRYRSHSGSYGWSFSIQRGSKVISSGHGYNSLRLAKNGVASLAKALQNPTVEVDGVKEK